MSGMSTPAGWGPSHQTSKRRRRRPWWFALPMYALIAVLWVTGASNLVFVVLFAAAFFVLSVIERKIKEASVAVRERRAAELAGAEDPLRAVRESCRRGARHRISGSTIAASFASGAHSARCSSSARRGRGKRAE